jgi:hypothetical protein
MVLLLAVMSVVVSAVMSWRAPLLQAQEALLQTRVLHP